MVLEQQQKGEYYNDELFHNVLHKATEGTDGKLTERQVAEMVNYMVFKGL